MRSHQEQENENLIQLKNPLQPLYYGAARLTFGQNPESVSTSTTSTTTTTPATTTTNDASDENFSPSAETVSNNGAKRSGKGPKVFVFHFCTLPYFPNFQICKVSVLCNVGIFFIFYLI